MEDYKMGVIENTLKTKQLKDLVKPRVKKEKDEKKLTKEDVEELIPLLVEVEANNGFLGIAYKKRISVEDVKAVWNAMQERIAELQPKEEALE